MSHNMKRLAVRRRFYVCLYYNIFNMVDRSGARFHYCIDFSYARQMKIFSFHKNFLKILWGVALEKNESDRKSRR